MHARGGRMLAPIRSSQRLPAGWVKLVEMSFLDDLENNLKNLESSEDEKDGAERERRARESERARAQAAAPFAEELKKGPYGQEVLRQAALLGHTLRTKVHVAWIGASLRLEARERRLEFRPTASGVVAVHLDGARETASAPVNLKSSPEPLIRDWLSSATATEDPDTGTSVES
jgi:hypothetical protein